MLTAGTGAKQRDSRTSPEQFQSRRTLAEVREGGQDANRLPSYS